MSKGILSIAFDKRMDKIHQINSLKAEIQRIEAETMQGLIDQGAFECFSINWRAVHRRTQGRKP